MPAIDWTFAVFLLSLTGTVANIFKKRWCFALWLVSNIVWCVYDWRIGAKWQAVQMGIYACLAVWGFVKWRE